MAKPIRIELEFTGWQRAVVTHDGDVERPLSALEMSKTIAADIERRFAESVGRGKLKVRVRPI